jgi:hypothetical protein
MSRQPRDYKACIFGLSGPDGQIRFIGKSRWATQTISDFRSYARTGRKIGSPVYDWIREIGPENLKLTIIEKFQTTDMEIVGDARAWLIKEYLKNDAPLLNTRTAAVHRGR